PPSVLPSFPTRRSSDLRRFIKRDSLLGNLLQKRIPPGNSLPHFGRSAYNEIHGKISLNSHANLQRLVLGAPFTGHDHQKVHIGIDRKSTRLNSSHVSIS